MPVQENEQPKKTEEFFGNDEEKRRQDMPNSQENSTKLNYQQRVFPILPF